MLDQHADPDHHRTVLTLGGASRDVEDAARHLARAAVELLDIGTHTGAHPRFGVLDVVPFVPVGGHDLGGAVAARDEFARWAASELGLPCFLYGPMGGSVAGESVARRGGGRGGGAGDDFGGAEWNARLPVRTLPEVRRRAFRTLPPDAGPSRPHPTAGAAAVGARPPLVAYNLWVGGVGLAAARRVAAALRGPAVRALGFDLPGGMQVSCNLVDPGAVGPADVVAAAEVLLSSSGGRVERCELVGLLPAAVLAAVPPERWAELDLAADRTVEARLTARGDLTS